VAEPTTTAVEAKVALKAGLEALPGLTGTQISWSYPSKPQAEMIVLGNIDDSDQEPGSLGNMTREESYSIAVIVNVLKKASAEVVATRAVELAGEVKRYLDANPDLGVERIKWAGVTAQPIREAISGDGRMAEIPLKVTVEARLPRS
jgi:hypothetical protein